MKKAKVKEIKQAKVKVKIPVDKKKVVLIVTTALFPPVGAVVMTIDYLKERKEEADRIEVEMNVKEAFDNAKKADTETENVDPE